MKKKETRTLATIGYPLVAIVLGIIAFLPWGTWLNAGRQADAILFHRALRDWLVWGGLLLVLASVANVALGDRLDNAIESRLASLSRGSGKIYAVLLSLAAAALAAVVSVLAFERNPHILDTMAQLFQARIFAAGQLSAPVPERLEFFVGQYLVQNGGRWFSQYPPGHSAFLALGLWMGVPWLVNPLALAGTVLLVYGIARRLLGERTGRLAAALYSLSPFVLLMSGSYMNHVTAALFLTLTFYAVVRVVEDGAGGWWIAAAGAAMGVAVAIRPLEAVAWTAALALWLAVRRGWSWALAFGGMCGVAVTPLLAYNAYTTGHALRFGYTLLWGAGHGLGFHPDPWGEPFTPLRSFANTAFDLQRLNVDLLGWPLPSLLFLLLALAVAGRDQRVGKSAGILVALLVAAPVAYFFYWHHDSYLGPRFLYASLVPAVLLTASGIGSLDRCLARRRLVLRIVVASAVGYALAAALPRNAGVVAGMAPDFNLHPDVQAERAGIDETAVVFVKVGWGSRLAARLRGWEIPANDVERSLHAVDGCRIQLALDDADSLAALGHDPALAGAELRRRLAAWRSADLAVSAGQFADAGVRLDSTQPLAARCRAEARWDESGFIRFEPFVWRNDPWLRRGVIYARYLSLERNQELKRQFAGRRAYLYARASREPGVEPVLVPIAFPDAGEGDEAGVSDTQAGR
jgi:hypothetical protein